MQVRKIALIAALTIALIQAFALSGAVAAAADASTAVSVALPAIDLQAVIHSAGPEGDSAVSVDFFGLRALLNAAADDHRPVTLTLADISITTTTLDFDLRPDGFTFVGGGDETIALDVSHAYGDPTAGPARLVAELRKGQRMWRIQPSEDQPLHEIVEVDLTSSPSYEPPGGTPTAAANASDAPDSDVGTAALVSGSGPNIDIVVLYTGASRTDNLASDLRIAASNGTQANQRSGISGQFNLLAIEQTAFQEDPAHIDQDLGRLTDPSSALHSQAVALRDRFGADVAVLIGTGYSGGSSACGLAHLMNTVSTTFRDHAFAVIDNHPGCFAESTLVHEVGHIAALRHDWANSDEERPFEWWALR